MLTTSASETLYILQIDDRSHATLTSVFSTSALLLCGKICVTFMSVLMLYFSAKLYIMVFGDRHYLTLASYLCNVCVLVYITLIDLTSHSVLTLVLTLYVSATLYITLFDSRNYLKLLSVFKLYIYTITYCTI